MECFGKEILKKFLQKFENKIRTLNKYIDNENEMSFRKAIGYQVRSFVNMIENED